MRILITGDHGFVGNNLAAYLTQEHVIYGLDLVTTKKSGVVKTYTWDDLDNGEIPEVDAVVHLAGLAHDTKNATDAEKYFQVNTALTQKIYDWYLQSPARKFVFFSTVKAAADRVEGVLTEDVVPAPVGPYGESKRMAEEYILAHLPSDKDVYIIRPCMIIGPGNKGNLNLLYKVVRKGIPWPLGAFENRRTFTSIENACFIVKSLLTREVPSGIYNINDDDALSTNELVEGICDALGKKPHIWHLPKGLMTGVAKVGGWLHLPLNPERLRKLTEDYISSNAKIKAALGVERLPVNARDGLKRAIDSFK